MKRLITALVAFTLLTGCSTPADTPKTHSQAKSDQFENLLQECEAVTPEQIAETVGSGSATRYFFGAVCMWTVATSLGEIDVTFGWFENNALLHEREVATKLGYRVTTVAVDDTAGFSALRPGDPPTCGVSATYSGVITWWVQSVDGGPDPCDAAAKLVALTLMRNL
ncbi:DUF3558 domain-containing protein [Antrihabitans stalactiti]|uniref:DUF3558 domain-containing protein n=1 Tax=Antrihabitans stalactiti TaxID=2584121 RepID=A0A848KNB8_9NOCA|nr:DUF3558 domain-containing protein [Antrihabitans stalactiti]NMN97800.1 DUF3558 domain-containing protein [Antrihabitans stalactiti]